MPSHIDFELRTITVENIPNMPYLAYAVVFRTDKDRRNFVTKALQLTEDVNTSPKRLSGTAHRIIEYFIDKPYNLYPINTICAELNIPIKTMQTYIRMFKNGDSIFAKKMKERGVLAYRANGRHNSTGGYFVYYGKPR